MRVVNSSISDSKKHSRFFVRFDVFAAFAGAVVIVVLCVFAWHASYRSHLFV